MNNQMTIDRNNQNLKHLLSSFGPIHNGISHRNHMPQTPLWRPVNGVNKTTEYENTGHQQTNSKQFDNNEVYSDSNWLRPDVSYRNRATSPLKSNDNIRTKLASPRDIITSSPRPFGAVDKHYNSFNNAYKPSPRDLEDTLPPIEKNIRLYSPQRIDSSRRNQENGFEKDTSLFLPEMPNSYRNFKNETTVRNVGKENSELAREYEQEEQFKLEDQRRKEQMLDLRDYHNNNAQWAGYQDRPVVGGVPIPSEQKDNFPRNDPYKINSFRSRNQSPPRDVNESFKQPGNFTEREDFRNRQYPVDRNDGRVAYSYREGMMPPNHEFPQDGALLFVLFPTGRGENTMVASHAFLKSKPTNMGGRFLGLSPRVFNPVDYDEADNYHDVKALAVYHFPGIDKAERFIQYDHIIRQHDFPPPSGISEIWAVQNAYLPSNSEMYSTFMMTVGVLHEGSTLQDFVDYYKVPFTEYLESNGAAPFVVFSYSPKQRKTIRRFSYPDKAIVIVHLFRSFDHYHQVTHSDAYMKYHNRYHRLVSEKSSYIFNINRDPCP